MILITGAAGKTGLALLRGLSLHQRPVRALVRHRDQVDRVLRTGATEACVGDLLDLQSMVPAFSGVTAVYHIPPNVHPQEEQIAEYVLQLSSAHRVKHFIYHSVLRPYIRAMPHHINKARVEEHLFTSGLPFTILQPAAYMQNTLAGMPTAREEGVFHVPYPIDTQLGMVDLEEIAEVGCRVIEAAEHVGATYELCGGEVLTPVEIANTMALVLGRSVEARQTDLETWQRDAEAAGMSAYQVETLLKMFRYYAEHGFWGNATTLTALLGRAPKTYSEFLAGMDAGRRQVAST